MKMSQYNIFSSKNRLMFNTNTRAMAILSDLDYSTLTSNDIDFTRIDKDLYKDLVDNGFVVDDCRNEIAEVKDAYWRKKFGKENLHITVMTTLDCNFRCTYCFETHKDMNMYEDTIEKVKKMVAKELSSGYSSLSVDWYGGEPLMNMQCILELSEFFIELCKEKNIDYSASITTNGFEFTDTIQKKLLSLRVSHAQITLDGGKDIHDKRRRSLCGKSSFEVICKNLENTVDGITVSIRINVDNENKDDLKNVINALCNCRRDSMGIYACIVTPTLNSNYKIENRKELMDSIFDMYFYAIKQGFQISNINGLITNEYRACIVDLDSHYIITPNGELFRCGESYEEDDPGKVGNILVDGSKNLNNEKLAIWSKDPFSYELCIGCRYLPICMGGCAMKRVTRDKDYCLWEMKEYHEKSLELLYIAICKDKGCNIDETISI